MRIRHHQYSSGLLSRGDDAVGFGQAIGDGLFEKHMATGLQTIDGNLWMQMMRNQNESTIDILKAGTIVGDNARSRFARQGKGRFRIRIRNPDDLSLTSQLTQPRNVKRCDPSTAYESDPMRSHGYV